MRLALLFALANAGKNVLAAPPPTTVRKIASTGQITKDITKPPTAKPEPLSLLAGFLICTKAMMARMKPMQLSPGRNARINEATAMPEVLGSVGMP